MTVPLTSDPTVVSDDKVVTPELTSVPVVGRVKEVLPVVASDNVLVVDPRVMVPVVPAPKSNELAMVI